MFFLIEGELRNIPAIINGSNFNRLVPDSLISVLDWWLHGAFVAFEVADGGVNCEWELRIAKGVSGVGLLIWLILIYSNN